MSVKQPKDQEPQDPGYKQPIPDLDMSDVYADADRMREEHLLAQGPFDVLSDWRFENGWSEEQTELLSDAEVLDAVEQIAKHVAASQRRQLAQLVGSEMEGSLGSETRDALIDAFLLMANTDW